MPATAQRGTNPVYGGGKRVQTVQTGKGKQNIVPAHLRPGNQPKKPHRYRPGTVALREIRKYQKSTDQIITQAGFRRLMEDVVQDPDVCKLSEFPNGVRFDKDSRFNLKEAVESFIVHMLEDANIEAIHAKRVTVKPKDIHIVLRIRNQSQYLRR